MEELRRLAEVAATMIESDAKYDHDICKMSILFPFLEQLGYDATRAGDFILNPAYTNNGEYKTYGISG